MLNFSFFRRFVSSFLLSIIFVFYSTQSFSTTPLKVVTSFSILADLAERIGGDHVTVTSIVGPNGDSHVYEPTPKDAQQLAHADLIIINGLGFEGWIDRLISASGYKGEVVNATESVQPYYDTSKCKCKNNSHDLDPHAWHSLQNAKSYARTIRDRLIKLDPIHQADYDQRLTEFEKDCDALHEETLTKIAVIPHDKRLVVTTHDGFRYLGKSYDIRFMAPVGLSTDADPSAKVLAELIDYIKKNKVPVVFLENITSPKLMKQIAEETGTKVGPILYSDALSDKAGPASTYLDMMRYNITALLDSMTTP